MCFKVHQVLSSSQCLVSLTLCALELWVFSVRVLNCVTSLFSLWIFHSNAYMLLLTFQTVSWLEGWESNSRCERLCMTNQFPFVIVFLSNTWLLFLFVGDAVAKTHSGIWQDLQVSLWSPVCCIHCRSRHGCSSPPSRRQSTTKSQHGILAGVQRFTGESHGAHFCVSVVSPSLSLLSCGDLVMLWRSLLVIWEIRLFCVGNLCVCWGEGSRYLWWMLWICSAVKFQRDGNDV